MRIDAEKSQYLVEQLQVVLMPTVVLRTPRLSTAQRFRPPGERALPP